MNRKPKQTEKVVKQFYLLLLQSIYKSYTFTHLFNVFTNILVFINIYNLLTEVKLSYNLIK